MNFSQLVEHVRLEVQRRIERGTLSVSLLARQTGLGQGHVSNFLHARRGVSATTLDKILNALQIGVEDLLPAARTVPGPWVEGQRGDTVDVPVVSADAAMFERYIRGRSVREQVTLTAELVRGLRTRCPPARKRWQRFVAVRIGAAGARGMRPEVRLGALLVVDRHYTSLTPYDPSEPSLYAVRDGEELVARYAEYTSSRLVLRPLQMSEQVRVIAVSSRDEARQLVIGRVLYVGNRR
jgi:transcriptional regulator with XRE-family HTH domain